MTHELQTVKSVQYNMINMYEKKAKYNTKTIPVCQPIHRIWLVAGETLAQKTPPRRLPGLPRGNSVYYRM